MKLFARLITRRPVWVALIILLQIALNVALIGWLRQLFPLMYIALTLLSLLLILVLVERDDIQPAYKTMWILLIMLLPPTGALFYLYWGQHNSKHKRVRQYRECDRKGRALLDFEEGERRLAALYAIDPPRLRCATFLARQAGAPLYTGTHVEYCPWGQEFFDTFVQAVSLAEKSIYLEFFILRAGHMWNTTVELLKQKAQAGLDVRILYDSIGSLVTLPDESVQELRNAGVRVVAVSPVKLSRHISDYSFLNHRDHRKIALLDGQYAFVGGLNFGDEYINQGSPYGVWKDTGLWLDGSAVHKLTIMFLEMWEWCTGESEQLPPPKPQRRQEDSCFVQPYGDNPVTVQSATDGATRELISSAQKYLYISTPYLIITSGMQETLTLAARSGVDVRILVPGIPDKKYVYLVTQSFYSILLQAGVRIFEYTPGFNHAKMYVADDKAAIVGSANMDYRSMYLHFENCCAVYGGPVPATIRKDLEACMEQCHEVTLEEVQKVHWPKRILQMILRTIGPLM